MQSGSRFSAALTQTGSVETHETGPAPAIRRGSSPADTKLLGLHQNHLLVITVHMLQFGSTTNRTLWNHKTNEVLKTEKSRTVRTSERPVLLPVLLPEQAAELSRRLRAKEQLCNVWTPQRR